MRTMCAEDVPDGIYILAPEGSGWIGVKVRDGRVVATCEESLLGTFVASGDSRADLAPRDDDEINEDDDLHDWLVREVMGNDTDPELVTSAYRDEDQEFGEKAQERLARAFLDTPGCCAD